MTAHRADQIFFYPRQGHLEVECTAIRRFPQVYAYLSVRSAMDDEDGYFGERVAARYDESYSDMFEPSVVDAVVEVLAGLAGGGRALELGIGTGRIALPLARRGVAVHGIDLSRAMIARLRAKPGGKAIGVTIGDFATARADGMSTVAFLVFNTIMNLTTQAAQVACFRRTRALQHNTSPLAHAMRIPNIADLQADEMRLRRSGSKAGVRWCR